VSEAPPLDAEDREALRKAAGDDALEEHAPLEVDGTRLACTLRPRDVEALARALRALAERGLPALVRGGGSRLALGNPPRGARLQLATGALHGIVELDAAEGVLCARAGTPLAALRDALEDGAWELPFDPPGARATLGGVLAAAAIGPRHAGYGRPRDVVLGLETVLGDGLRARSGGRVVKNVTGYDLTRLQVGALGSLGVIASAWLRLRPRPARVAVLSAALGGAASASDGGAPGAERCAQALAAARLPSVRAAALADPDLAAALEPSREAGDGWLLVVELGGDEAAVARDARLLAERCGAAAASPGAVARLRALQGETFGPVGLRFRLAVLPSRLPEVSARLARDGAALLAYPGSGLVFARFALELDGDAAGADRAWRAAREAARAGEGTALLEAAPAWAKSARDVFGDPPDAAPLLRALKQRFDPAGVLNPGRGPGFL
jgi:glycolate oxidase FAD binding subunit